MKICAIICEYNPFHNGHKYLIEEAKKQSNADALLCIMSGNFTQRGEAAILEKHQRARHAVEGGADIVLELPTVFATSNAEVFARGAVSILSKIPNVTHLAFGAEVADKNAFLQATNALLNEPKNVSDTVKHLVSGGMGYAQAIAEARAQVADKRLFSSPNNILGIEYTKALLAQKASMDILPIQRVGSGYNETVLGGKFSSATAIRAAILNGAIDQLSAFIPASSLSDLTNAQFIGLDLYEKTMILRSTNEELAAVLDCTEGLEHAFKKAASGCETLEKALTSPRYTAARIRRIALQNLLEIQKEFIFECLQGELYLHPLAYKRERTDVLSALSCSALPLISSGIEKGKLCGAARQCLEIDELSEKMYAALSQKTFSNKTVLV